MKKHILLPFIPLLALSLSSCGVNVHHDIKEYVLETNYKTDMRILQLNDIHMEDKDNRELQYKFIDLTIKEAQPHMIVLDGDVFTFASKYTAKELFAFIDSYKVPWTMTLGNHDEQCYFSVDWLTGYLNNYGSYCLFKDIQDDDVFGNANFAINLKKDGKVFETIVMMDSNRYYFNEYFGYDYIKEDQIAWYESLIKFIASLNNNEVVPSLAFFHVPFPEFLDAWEAYEKGEIPLYKEGGVKGEGVAAPEINSHFFDKILELGSTKGVFCAHDHANNYAIEYKGVVLSYGVNSTNRVYYTEDLMGGQVITLHEDHSFDIDYIFHHYNEVQ